MTTTTLTTDDLAVGEQVEIALVPGPQLVKLRVIASPGGGGGGVTAVTASAPLTSSGGPTPNIAIDASYPAVADFWPFDRPIPASVVAPELSQADATSGGGQIARWRTQKAFGAGTLGGDWSVILGQSNPTIPASLGPFAWIGASTGPGTTENPPNNYFNYAIGKWLAGGGVINWVWGGGNDNGGGGVTAVEFSCFRPWSFATENNSPISFVPGNGSGQHSSSTFLTDSSAGPVLQLAGFSGVFPSAAGGIVRLPWESASTLLVAQRNSTNTGDLQLMSRQAGVMTWGDLAEPQNIYGGQTIVYKIDGAGAGHSFQGPSGTSATVAIDIHNTIVQGDSFPVQFDSKSTQGPFQADTTSTAANQTIALIDLPAGTLVYALTHLFVKIEALNESTGDFATFSHRWAFTISGGVVTAPTGAQPAAVDDGHSVGAGVLIAPQFAIVGSQIAVQVTPWTASGIHWTVFDDRYVNAGKKPLPTAPPGAPVYWFRADLQGLGAAAQMTDQSGHGNNLSPIVGTPRTVTAGSGPGGTLPSLQFPAGTNIYGIASALGLGTTNFTIAIVGQVTSTSAGQEAFVCIGAGAGTDGTAIGVDLNVASERGALMPNGIVSNPVADGAATTAWEAWVFSSDAAGNLTLVVNGVGQPLSPANQTATTPRASFTVGGSFFDTFPLEGAVFEIIAYDAIESSSAIYAYQHAITGL